jgi:hypothetical protein
MYSMRRSLELRILDEGEIVEVISFLGMSFAAVSVPEMTRVCDEAQVLP